MLKALLVVFAIIAATSATQVSSRLSPFGIVEGIKDCGSTGKLGTVDVDDCTAVPCVFAPGRIYNIAIRFTASVTSTSLSLIVYRVEADGTTLILTVPIIGEIQAGIEYEMKLQLPISTDFSGLSFDIRFYVLDIQNIVYEVCAEAAVKIL